jgi:hypothetical protein
LAVERVGAVTDVERDGLVVVAGECVGEPRQWIDRGAGVARPVLVALQRRRLGQVEVVGVPAAGQGAGARFVAEGGGGGDVCVVDGEALAMWPVIA